MKVLKVNNLYPPTVQGGAERSVCDISESLVRDGVCVTVATLTPAAEPRDETINGVLIHRLPLDNFYWAFTACSDTGAAKRLAWHIRDMWNPQASARIGALMDLEMPDILHSDVLTGLTVAVWREAVKRRIPIVHTLRDYSLLCRRSGLYKDNRNCVDRCIECKTLTLVNFPASRMVDHVVSISRHLLKTHLDFGMFGDTPATVLPNIVRGQISPPDRRTTPKDRLVFGFFGRVVPDKGIEILLEATRALPDDGWSLRIGGTGEESYLQRLRDRYPDPRIEWLGFQNPSDYYPTIDVLIFPALWAEPLGRTAIEAYLHGCSAICAKAGGIPEMALHGRQVQIVAPGDVESLVDTMSRAIAHREQWKQGGFRTGQIPHELSESTIIEAHRKIYRSLLPAERSASAGAHREITPGGPTL